MEKTRKRLGLVIIVAVLIGIVGVYSYNVNIAKCTVPYSDFFRWILDYSKEIISGKGIMVFFENDNSQHYQPLACLISMGFLHVVNYDFSMLVISGVVIKVAACIILLLIYFYNSKKTSISTMIFSSVLIVISMLNYNQWEIITEPFALASAVRVLLYMGSFWGLAVFFRTYSKRSWEKNCAYVIAIGLVNDVIIVTICGGYFAAYSFALIFTVIVAMLTNRSKQKYYLAVIYFLILFAGIIVYLSLSNTFDESGVGITVTIENIIAILDGFVLFWGTSLLPTTMANFSGMVEFYCIIGCILLIFMFGMFIFCIINNNKKGGDVYNLFAICLIVYANALGLSIAVARVPAYGIQTMMSSRYTVDSALGLMAFSFGFSRCAIELQRKEEKSFRIMKRTIDITLLLLCIILMGTSIYEGSKSKYIRGFYDEIEEQLQNIDGCSDEFLSSISGTKSQITRESLKYMKAQKISIYSK